MDSTPILTRFLVNPFPPHFCHWFPGSQKEHCWNHVFSRKVIENNGPLHFHEYNLFFPGAQVLCRQQFAFHLCDGVPAKSGARTLPSAHAWTRGALDLTKSGLLSLVRLDRVYSKTWDWPNCYAFFSFLVEILLHLFRVQEFEHLGLATWPVWWLEGPSKPIGAAGSTFREWNLDPTYQAEVERLIANSSPSYRPTSWYGKSPIFANRSYIFL